MTNTCFLSYPIKVFEKYKTTNTSSNFDYVVVNIYYVYSFFYMFIYMYKTCCYGLLWFYSYVSQIILPLGFESEK